MGVAGSIIHCIFQPSYCRSCDLDTDCGGVVPQKDCLFLFGTLIVATVNSLLSSENDLI
jgi:hypothetical protein